MSSIEDIPSKTETRHIEITSMAAEGATLLSEAHQAYLVQRHGTLDLDPIPSEDPADPYNWPRWKKTINLVLVSFHALMGPFTATSIICAYANIAKDLDISLQRASYLTSSQIAVLAGAPLFWKPVSNRFGRRPIFLLSLILSCVCNIGCAVSPDYASMIACRTIAAFAICPAVSIGSAVVMETFFKNERARYMGVWTVMVTLGVPMGPFIFGFVAQRASYKWIYWVLAMTNGVQLILYALFGPETRYINTGVTSQASAFKREYLLLRRIDPTPFKLSDFTHALKLFTNIPVLLAAVSYGMVFLFAVVMNSVEVPQLLQSKFNLDPQQLGLQFLGMIIGSVLGEQLGGSASDLWMKMRERRIGKWPAPEFRLWLGYIGLLLTPVGIIVFLVCTEQAPAGEWTVKPLVGVAIGSFGSQVVTTVMYTYSVDTYPQDAASVGVFINLIRSGWGFIGPFWFPPMYENVGVAASSGVATALIIGVSVIPLMLLHWQRRKRCPPESTEE